MHSMLKMMFSYTIFSALFTLSLYGCGKEIGKIALESEPNTNEINQPIGNLTSSGDLVNLGPQVFERSISGSQFIKDGNNDLWIYTVSTGTPARLLGYKVDGVTTVPQVSVPLTGATGSWTVIQATDGWLYVGTTNGIIFKHQPGTGVVENLGIALSGESYVWELVAGKNGEIFGTTYPGAKVFRYHPNSGFQEVSGGAVKAGENYARSIVYHKSSDKLYVGVGSHTGLIKLDPRTSAKNEILPLADQGLAGFVYYLGMVEGIASGDKILVTITGTTGNNKTLFYDINTGSYVHQIGVVVAKTVIKSPTSNIIYFTNSSSLYSCDLGNSPFKLVALNKSKSALATTWLDNNRLCYLTGEGKLIYYNVNTKNISETTLEIPPEPISINTVAYGPDGRIWTSGYPIGSNAAYNPSTGQTDMFQGLSQSESISSFGNDIYFGVYSGAKFYKYNTTQPWDISNNPKYLGNIAGQDRPFAYAGVPTQNRMYFGTVPGYGILGGALVKYDISSDNLSSTSPLIANHSIVSLLYSGGELYGGTSVWGGLGIQPIATEAKLFIVNPVTDSKDLEVVPVAGAKAITALMNGPDGHVWGIADGTLFIFDKTNRILVSTHELFSVSAEVKSKHVWKNAALLLHPSGRIFGVAYGELFELNPITKAKTVISNQASNALTMDANGDLYFHRGVNLWKYTP